MNQYHKINSIFKRDEKGNMLYGEYSDPEVEYLAENKWLFTEKVDGTNIRVKYFCPDPPGQRYGRNHLEFSGKTDKADTPKPLLDRLAELFPNIDKFYEKFGDTDVCLYGEGYGARIQKGGGDYTGDGSVDFILFDVRIGDWWLKREDVIDVADHFGIKVVPQIWVGTIGDAIKLVSGYGYLSQISAVEKIAEGVIGTPLVPLSTRNGKRIITKIKTVDFPIGWRRNG